MQPVVLLKRFETAWPGWYYDPRRWATADGVIPFPLFAILARAIVPAEAMERLHLARAIGLAFAGPEGEGPRLLEEALQDAYPEA